MDRRALEQGEPPPVRQPSSMLYSMARVTWRSATVKIIGFIFGTWGGYAFTATYVVPLPGDHLLLAFVCGFAFGSFGVLIGYLLDAWRR